MLRIGDGADRRTGKWTFWHRLQLNRRDYFARGPLPDSAIPRATRRTRADETLGDQFVEAEVGEEDLILPEVVEEDRSDADGENEAVLRPEPAREQAELAGRKRAHGQLPDRGVAEIHAVADVAHHEVAEADECEQIEECAALRLGLGDGRIRRRDASAVQQREDSADRQQDDDRVHDHHVDDVAIPWAVAGLDRVGEALGLRDEELVNLDEHMRSAGKSN
jgi:hypothetical protein